MANLDKLLKKIEKNYNEKDKKEIFEYIYGDETFEVLSLNRAEKAEFIFSYKGKNQTFKEAYEWFKPWIYKSFQLKETAILAKENGYIKTFYEVVDMLFEPEDILSIMKFIYKINDLGNFTDEVNKLQKKP